MFMFVTNGLTASPVEGVGSTRVAIGSESNFLPNPINEKIPFSHLNPSKKKSSKRKTHILSPGPQLYPVSRRARIFRK